MGWKLEKFFGNSLDRNGKGQRQDVEEPVVAFGTGRSEISDLRGDFEGYFKSVVYGQWFHGETQHNWIPQGQDTNSWDTVPWFATGQRNVCYWRNLDGSTSTQNMGKSRGTGTYIPDMVHSPFTLSLVFVLLKEFVSKLYYQSVFFGRVNNLTLIGS